MMKQSATLLVAVSLCFVAGCNRSTGNNAAANKATTNTVAPAANASVNAAAPAPAPTQVALALTPGGLEAREAGGRTSPLAFGTPAAQAVQGLTAMFGPPASDNVNSDCGAGPTRIVVWSNGLRILAQNDQFQGWEINRPGIYALGDLQVGMTRAQLEANQSSFEQTTLGTEWTVGDGDVTVSGLLGENGNVSAMWAGLTCHMT
jgi:hypothetical protein